jgi:hypothetical protein
MAERLIHLPTNIGDKDFADQLLAIAGSIERALIRTGATPGKDYTYLDLITRATPFLLAIWKKHDGLELDWSEA